MGSGDIAVEPPRGKAHANTLAEEAPDDPHFPSSLQQKESKPDDAALLPPVDGCEPFFCRSVKTL
jgi:hypothetical protein